MSKFTYKDQTYIVKENTKSDSYFSYYKCQNALSKDYVIIEKVNKPKLKAELYKLPISDTEQLFKGYIGCYQKEIEILKNTDNPYILKGYDFIEEKEQIILIKEFANMNLKNYIKNVKQKGLSSAEIRYIFSQLNKAIKYFRKKGNNHTCICNENVFLQFDEKGRVSDDFNVKIADFGTLPKFEVKCKFQLNVKGKIPFMAPELFIPKIDEKSDLYSLGILLYFLRFNELPLDNELYKTYGILPDPQDPLLKDLINKLILKDSSKRMSWNEYFKHPFWEIKEEERLELLQKKIRRKKTLLGTFKLQSPNPNTAEGGEEKKEEVIKNGNMGEIYENGDKYLGDFVNGKKEGKGIMTYGNGDRYEGEFSNDVKEGYGRMLYNNGEQYEGEFRYDVKEGYGIYHFLDGDTYKGDFKNDFMEGRGVFFYHSGEIYSGGFKNGKKDGYGCFFETNGNKYLGDFKNINKEECYFLDDRQMIKKENVVYNDSNVKNETPEGPTIINENVDKNFSGKLLKVYEDGTYEGEFVNGLKSGSGVYIYKNGDKYIGEFKNDEKNGIGAYYYNNGESYIGNYYKNKREGKGCYYYVDGDKFDGKFKKGKAEGFGKFYYSNGDRYFGNYKYDIKNGHGTYYYQDGKRYVGEFKEGIKHGKGIIVKKSGAFFDVIYEKNEILEKGEKWKDYE